jgi:hypothetical protein
MVASPFGLEKDRTVVKDPRLIDALRYLEDRLGAGSFVVMDKWEADPLATGIINPAYPDVLACIALNGGEQFMVNIIEVGRFECGSLEDVCWVVEDFLAIETSPNI